MKKMKLWVAVSHDKYELPLFVARSAAEMAEHFGVTQTNVMSSAYHARVDKVKGYRKFISVDVEFDDEELQQMGARAKKFVLGNKNNVAQARRIVEFIK